MAKFNLEKSCFIMESLKGFLRRSLSRSRFIRLSLRNSVPLSDFDINNILNSLTPNAKCGLILLF